MIKSERTVHASFGYDSVSLILPCNSRAEKNNLLQECSIIPDDNGKDTYNREDLPNVVFRKVPYKDLHITTTFSIPKLARHCEDNSRLSYPKETALALYKLCEATCMDWMNARPTRLDITTNMFPDFPFSDVAPLFLNSKFHTAVYGEYETTKYCKNSYSTLRGYDKNEELKSKGIVSKEQNSIRLEWQIIHRVAKTIGWKNEYGEFTAQSLTTNDCIRLCAEKYLSNVPRLLELPKYLSKVHRSDTYKNTYLESCIALAMKHPESFLLYNTKDKSRGADLLLKEFIRYRYNAIAESIYSEIESTAKGIRSLYPSEYLETLKKEVKRTYSPLRSPQPKKTRIQNHLSIGRSIFQRT